MSLIPHVNGEASLWTGTGSSGALEELGISVDGVSFKEKMNIDPVIIDTYGTTPYDYQYFLSEVQIDVDLVVWDSTILAKILGGYVGVTPGTFGAAGSLLVQGGNTFRLLVKSTPSGSGITGVEACHNFPNCFLIDNREVKFGTKRSIWKLSFKAMPTQQLSSTAGAVLWNTTCA